MVRACAAVSLLLSTLGELACKISAFDCLERVRTTSSWLIPSIRATAATEVEDDSETITGGIVHSRKAGLIEPATTLSCCTNTNGIGNSSNELHHLTWLTAKQNNFAVLHHHCIIIQQ